MQLDPDAEIVEPARPSLAVGEDTGSGGDDLGSPDADEKQKQKKKKDRTPEETEKKRGEIVDFYLERMVRELEKDVEAAPEDFYHLNFFCRKPLKEVRSVQLPSSCLWMFLFLDIQRLPLEQRIV